MYDLCGITCYAYRAFLCFLFFGERGTLKEQIVVELKSLTRDKGEVFGLANKSLIPWLST